MKTLKRFFTSQVLSPEIRTVRLDQKESHHLKNVLRLKQDDSCLVFDSSGNEWTGTVFFHERKCEVAIRLMGQLANPNKKKFSLAVAQAIPQRAKMDTIVEKAGELGVDLVIPMVTERTVVRMKKEEAEKARGRWLKIIQSARKQSRSSVATDVSEITSFESVLANHIKSGASYICHPGTEITLFDVINALRVGESSKRRTDVIIFIGPEGGFSDKEFRQAVAKGVQPVTFGKTILKSDTAFVAVVGAFQFGLS